MSLQKSTIFDEARKLPPIERAELIESLLESYIDKQQKEIDAAWAKEGESRIVAYNAGLLEDMPISKVFEEIERSEE
ncbi:MAG: addiction module protein [Chitinispirillaceae bacterium]|nr:addiction module protein [Chitinispirillaceae bacterium]